MPFLTNALSTLGGGAAIGGATGAFGRGVKNFLTGMPERNYQQSTLGQEQQPLYNQLLRAGMGEGAGGAFGGAADYYRGNLSNDPQDFDMFAAPEMRRFNQNIIPDLAEQFAGMGSGGLSSSGFRNAAINAGVDLSERLGAIRANLRQNSAAGLMNIGQQGLGQFNENIHRPATPGLFDSFAQGFGSAAGRGASMYFGGR